MSDPVHNRSGREVGRVEGLSRVCGICLDPPTLGNKEGPFQWGREVGEGVVGRLRLRVSTGFQHRRIGRVQRSLTSYGHRPYRGSDPPSSPLNEGSRTGTGTTGSLKRVSPHKESSVRPPSCRGGLGRWETSVKRRNNGRSGEVDVNRHTR